jgi:PAS domain S-box-containing protein
LRLGQFIRQSRAGILSSWEEAVRRTVSKAADLGTPALRDDIPILLDELAAAADAMAEGKPFKGSGRTPDAHALHRLEEGYNLAQVTAEYALLRGELLRWLGTDAGEFCLSNVNLINSLLDQAVGQAVTRYTDAHQRTLIALDRISEAALNVTDVDLLLGQLLAVLKDTTPAVDSATTLLREGDELRVRASVGLEEGSVGFAVKVGEGVAGEVALTRRPMLLRSAFNDPRIRLPAIRGSALQGLYCAPMMIEDRLIGVAMMSSRIAPEFSQEDLLLFRTTLSRASNHVVRAELATRERKARLDAEEQRRQGAEREHLLRLLVDGVKDHAIFLLDLHGRIASWNAGAERIEGYRAEEAIGMEFSKLFTQEDQEHGRPAYEMECAARKGTCEGEGTRVRKDGTTFEADVALWAIREGDELRGFVNFTKDITSRKRIEREREQLLEQSRQAVLARDEFISIAAHDLRSPLGSLLLQIQVVMRRMAASNGVVPFDWVRSRVEAMERQVRRFSALLDSLLDVSLMDAGWLRLALEDMDFAALTREVASRFDEVLRTAGCTLNLNMDPTVDGRCDRLRLDQIVTNLLSNAVKYGTGHPVEVDVHGDAQKVWIQVRDQGIGISPEQQRRIFQKFERVGDENAHAGSGLGLWIVKKIVERMGGTVSVESELGKGSTFTVELPRVTVEGGRLERGQWNGSPRLESATSQVARAILAISEWLVSDGGLCVWSETEAPARGLKPNQDGDRDQQAGDDDRDGHRRPSWGT